MHVPLDFQEEMYKKFYDIFENYNVLLEKNRYVSPLDLQKIKEQVGHTINWQDEAARNYKNPVLEQLILSHPELRIPLLYTGTNTILNSEE